jgi:hypothetical protein
MDEDSLATNDAHSIYAGPASRGKVAQTLSIWNREASGGKSTRKVGGMKGRRNEGAAHEAKTIEHESRKGRVIRIPHFCYAHSSEQIVCTKTNGTYKR